MKKDFLIIGVVIIVVVAGGFLGWRYVSFASLKSKCQAKVDSEKIEIKFEFARGVSVDDSEMIKEKILSIPGVRSFEFTSEEEALEDFKEKHKGDLNVMRALDYLPEGESPIKPYASINVDSTINLDSLGDQIRSKGLEYGFTISNFDYGGLTTGARNALSVLSFNFPFGDPKESRALKNCTKEGSSGLLRTILEGQW